MFGPDVNYLYRYATRYTAGEKGFNTLEETVDFAIEEIRKTKSYAKDIIDRNCNVVMDRKQLIDAWIDKYPSTRR